MSLSLLDVEAEYIPCEPGNEFKASFVMVKVALSNSVGAVYTPDEIKEWFDLVKDYRLTLVLDETYSGFVESRRVLHKLFEEDGYRRILVSLKSFSTVRHSDPSVEPNVYRSALLVPRLALAPLLPLLHPDILNTYSELFCHRRLFEQTFSEEFVHAGRALEREQQESEDVARLLVTRFGVVILLGRFFMPSLGDKERWQRITGTDKIRMD
nr:hypothetical protein L203_03531 [Cryptococcus depauperatus CBS 7841]